MSDPAKRVRRIALQLIRVALFAVIIGLIHAQHAKLKARRQLEPSAPVQLSKLRKFFPDAQSQAIDNADGRGRREVLDAEESSLGYVVQTSPDSDHLIGFSGPTNTLVAFDRDDRIVGIEILSSGDTRDHVAEVLQDDKFLESFNGLTWEEAAMRTDVDVVSGATLTSLAIQESIIHRLSGGRPSLRFPNPLTVDDARTVFEAAETIEQDDRLQSLWHVSNRQGKKLGEILRTSPAADNIIGYQGPTEARIVFDTTGSIVGLSIGSSYDNDEYVTYVREDTYFLTLFNELKLPDLASLDLEEAEVEGVSGATMTSMAVAEGLIAAAKQHQQALESAKQSPEPILKWTSRDLGTAGVICGGLIIAFTSLRGNKVLRIGFQLVLIVYLGLINGDMLSQAMIVGWAQTGVPWSRAGGLVLLTLAAFLVPLTTRRNAYCTHLCPHGAAQQLLKNRLPFRFHLSNRLSQALRLIPAVLLMWCVVVAMAALPFSLVDIEPFDAWVFRVAGWATITIAIVGLAASLFVPMAYCRYGCPTGALLNFLRNHSRSDCWSGRDWCAVMLVVLASGLWIAI